MKKIFQIIVLSLCASFSFLVAAAKPSSIENQLTENAEKSLQSWGLKFFEETVNINSGTMNKEGISQLADIYTKKLKDLGFDVTRIDLAKVDRASHVFATRKGAKGSPRLLLIGHMDTVFENSSGFLKFKKDEAGSIEGPGVSDMKGGNLVLLTALDALKASGELDKMNITVALMGDEEAAGKDADGSTTTSRGPLIEAARNSDYALCFEPRNWTDDGVIPARRSSSSWNLEVKGKTGHSSLIFSSEMGPGATYPIARIVNRFYESLHKEKYLTFNVGNLSAASSVEVLGQSEGNETSVKGKRNIIPPIARATGDVRTISEKQLTATRAKMRKIVDQEIAKFNKGLKKEAWVSAEITFKDGIPSMTPVKGNEKLLQQLSQVSEDLGFGSLKGADPMKQGAADIAFASSYVSGALDGLGPIGYDYHTPKERTDWKSIVVASKRAAVFLHRLATTGSSSRN